MGDALLLRISMLGRFEIALGSQVIPDELWRRRKAKSLIKLLALARQHRLSRDQLMEILWPDQSPDRAANSLHQTLHLARRVLQAANLEHHCRIRLEQGTVSLASTQPCWIDVEAFEAGAAAARQSRDPAAYVAALDLYAGDLLPEDLYEEWACRRREDLHLSYVQLLEELADLRSTVGDAEGAVAALRRLVAAEPAAETAHRRLIRLYLANGARQLALRQYKVLCDALQRELGVGPDDESIGLFHQLTGHTPTSFSSNSTASSQISNFLFKNL